LSIGVARDPTKQNVLWDYPGLPYDRSTESGVELIRAENDCLGAFLANLRAYVPVWEYGYYFVGRYLREATITPRSALVAAMVVDAYGAHRASFLSGARGYVPDAGALLRKVHESCIRAAGCRAFPKKALHIARSNDMRKAEGQLKLTLGWVYSIESGFAHSNQLRISDTVTALSKGRPPPGYYGPRMDRDLLGPLAKVSAFWLYFLVRLLPQLIPVTPSQSVWLALQPDSAGMLRGYLKDAESELVSLCDEVDALAERLSEPT
jgi:hypothetical protein